MTTRNPTAVVLVLLVGTIMATLDQTIVNVALDTLSLEFGVGLGTIQWVATGYSLALGAVVPASAWLVGRVGAKRLYSVALAAFALGSVLAGLSWNIESLIAFRVLQGASGGLLMPVAMTILLRAAGPDRLGRAMSTLGLAILVGPLLGPVLGGYLIDEVSWRAMFFVNLPLGVLALALTARVIPADAPEPPRAPDVRGLLLLSPGLALLIYGVTAAGEHAGFAAPAVWGPMLTGALLIAAFVRHSLITRAPLVDLRILANRTTGIAATALALFATGYFGSMLLLPLYFQIVRGDSALAAGALGIPFALASGTTMQVAGRLIDRVPPGRYLPFSITVALTGFTLFAVLLDTDAPYGALAAAMLLMGAGGGGTMMPLLTTATRPLRREQQPAGSTVLNMISTTATVLGTAITSVTLGALLPVDGGLQELHALPPADRAALTPALADAFQHTYLIAPLLIALAAVPALLLPRRPAPESLPRRTERLPEPA
ncbi:DHA2 family efflux MFS transporter permease subunit [Nocardia thailandica]|uniref:DHA2 family efflux MFS transporter permease subunit n=1 Tax=Nocardia thailandica TaxID=257275 RepID=UPI0002ED6DC0|nr:DHA2 family efflux MFS transporter permease subunit [Nocardia thailandica]